MTFNLGSDVLNGFRRDVVGIDLDQQLVPTTISKIKSPADIRDALPYATHISPDCRKHQAGLRQLFGDRLKRDYFGHAHLVTNAGE